MIFASPAAASGLASDCHGRVHLVAAHGGDHVGDLLQRTQRHGFQIEPLRLRDAPDHVMEGGPVLRDAETMPAELVHRCQPGREGLRGHQDGGEVEPLLFMQGAADHLQFALACQREEAAGQRGDADIDIPRHGCGGDGLGGFEEAELHIHALGREIAAGLRQIQWCWGQRVQQPQANRCAGPCRPRCRRQRQTQPQTLPTGDCRHVKPPLATAPSWHEAGRRARRERRPDFGRVQCGYRGLLRRGFYGARVIDAAGFCHRVCRTGQFQQSGDEGAGAPQPRLAADIHWPVRRRAHGPQQGGQPARELIRGGWLEIHDRHQHLGLAGAARSCFQAQAGGAIRARIERAALDHPDAAQQIKLE